MSAPFPALAFEPRLSDRVATVLRERIGSGALGIADQLPSEYAMAEEFGVSRTVVREAVSRLKSEGLLYTRQGKGIFVAPAALIRPLRIPPEAARSMQSVLSIVEMRRALEGEAAALAAERRTRDDVAALRRALRTIDSAVKEGGTGVAEDVAFHRLIAEITGNPFLLDVLEYVGQFLREATTITRANEARRTDFARQVKREHEAVLQAIVAQDAEAARATATQHMVNAAGRIRQADPEFWRQNRPLFDDLLRARPAAPAQAAGRTGTRPLRNSAGGTN